MEHARVLRSQRTSWIPQRPDTRQRNGLLLGSSCSVSNLLDARSQLAESTLRGRKTLLGPGQRRHRTLREDDRRMETGRARHDWVKTWDSVSTSINRPTALYRDFPAASGRLTPRTVGVLIQSTPRMITTNSIRQDKRVFCGISQVYKSTSAMRSRAPPTTPTLAGPTQQHQLDLGPSNHALRRTRNTHALSRTRRDPPRHHTDVAPLAARPASSRYTTKIRIPHTPSHAPRIADSNGTRQVTNEHTLLAHTTVRCTNARAHRASQTPTSRAITSYTISTFAR